MLVGRPAGRATEADPVADMEIEVGQVGGRGIAVDQVADTGIGVDRVSVGLAGSTVADMVDLAAGTVAGRLVEVLLSFRLSSQWPFESV